MLERTQERTIQDTRRLNDSIPDDCSHSLDIYERRGEFERDEWHGPRSNLGIRPNRSTKVSWRLDVSRLGVALDPKRDWTGNVEYHARCGRNFHLSRRGD